MKEKKWGFLPCFLILFYAVLILVPTVVLVLSVARIVIAINSRPQNFNKR